MRNLVLAALAVACLSGCGGNAAGVLATISLGVQGGQTIYCTAVDPAAKQALRNAVSGGRQVIACPEGTVTTKVAP